MEEPAKKRTRALALISLGQKSYANHSGIEALLKHISAHGTPFTSSRKVQYDARKTITRTVTAYGPMVVDVDVPLAAGGTTQIPFQNPLACFVYQCKDSPHYASIVQEALRRHPCTPGSPWKLILYQDGVDPSDMGSKNHSRKCVFYWSFAELGMRALAREEVWCTLCTVRFSQHQKFAGTVSALFEKGLSLFFGDPHDILRSGVAVEFPDGARKVMFARAGVLLADMPAIKECIYCKGHSGVICCPLCLNAFKHVSGESVPLHLLTPVAVSIANADIKAFTQLTRETLHAIIRKIRESYDRCQLEVRNGGITKDEFEQTCIMCGWTYTPANVIRNDTFKLDMPRIIMYDWAHIYVHDGLADEEFGLCMKALQKENVCNYREFGP